MQMPSLQTVGQIGIAVLMVLALAVDLRDDHSIKPVPVPPPHAADTLRTELLRCQLLGKAALDDATCTAVWAENRRRFFGSHLGASAPHRVIAEQKAKTP